MTHMPTKLRRFVICSFQLLYRNNEAVALLLGVGLVIYRSRGSSTGWAPLRSGLGLATYTCVHLSRPSSIIWYRPRGLIFLTGKVTAVKVTAAYDRVCD